MKSAPIPTQIPLPAIALAMVPLKPKLQKEKPNPRKTGKKPTEAVYQVVMTDAYWDKILALPWTDAAAEMFESIKTHPSLNRYNFKGNPPSYNRCNVVLGKASLPFRLFCAEAGGKPFLCIVTTDPALAVKTGEDSEPVEVGRISPTKYEDSMKKKPVRQNPTSVSMHQPPISSYS